MRNPLAERTETSDRAEASGEGRFSPVRIPMRSAKRSSGGAHQSAMVTLLIVILIGLAMYYLVRPLAMDAPYKAMVQALVLIATIVWVAQRCGVFAHHLHFPS